MDIIIFMLANYLPKIDMLSASASKKFIFSGGVTRRVHGLHFDSVAFPYAEIIIKKTKFRINCSVDEDANTMSIAVPPFPSGWCLTYNHD